MTDSSEVSHGGENTTPPWLLPDVEAVILAAIDRDEDELIRRLQHIGIQGGHVAMFSACVAWATSVGILSGMEEAMQRTHADGVGLIPVGGPIDETAPGTFAARFLAAVLNQQIDTAHSLFDATMTTPEHHQRCIGALLSMVGDFGRLKQAEVAAGRVAARRRDDPQRRRRPTRRGRRGKRNR